MADKVLAPETRTVTAPIEMREEDGVPRLVGYAATFNQPYDMGAFRERIDPAAFQRTLAASPDVRLLIDHEGQPLARTKSGTLRLSDSDGVGLRVDAELDVTDPDVQRLLPKMRRGDLDQMSFAFRVPAGGDEWSDDYSMRTLREINLQGGDVSVVTYPANPGTSVSVREQDELAAKTVWVETLMRERRSGKEISAENLQRLMGIFGSLNTATSSLTDAHERTAELIIAADPQIIDETAGRSLRLAQAIATRLSV